MTCVCQSVVRVDNRIVLESDCTRRRVAEVASWFAVKSKDECCGRRSTVSIASTDGIRKYIVDVDRGPNELDGDCVRAWEWVSV